MSALHFIIRPQSATEAVNQLAVPFVVHTTATALDEKHLVVVEHDTGERAHEVARSSKSVLGAKRTITGKSKWSVSPPFGRKQTQPASVPMCGKRTSVFVAQPAGFKHVCLT